MKWIKEHSLSLALAGLLVIQSWAFYVLRYPEWHSQRVVDKLPVGTSHFMRHYWGEWMVSVLADTYGALVLVFLTKYLWERGSAESK